MIITDFTTEHIEQAVHIAMRNYEEERKHVPSLPPIDTIPSVTQLADNGLGVAVFEGGEMLGYLCSVSPFDNAFRSTDAVGVYSPMGANGTINENRAKIYARLYQAAGEKWVRAGASSHAVCLYAHDKEAHEQFFRYGFGMRCVDAIRKTDEIPSLPCKDYVFAELDSKDILDILPLDNLHVSGYKESPFFMVREQVNEAEFLADYENCQSIYFTAKYDGQIVAYIMAEQDGENFLQDIPGYLHVKSVYCLPEHRGKGINQNLLGMLVQKIKAQGYTRLGVDFESINPAGYGFWLKHFDAYTHGVVRRIDDHVFR